jgi:hypothetical protein
MVRKIEPFKDAYIYMCVCVCVCVVPIRKVSFFFGG